MAPATSTCTCWKTLFEKSGANGAKSRIIVAGRVRILRSPLLAEIGDERVPYPFLSRMAAQQTASAHGSINALRLFAGWCARATRKKSLTFTQRVPPRAHKEALSHSGRTPKGYPQGDGARSLRVAHFRALATFFWPRSQSRVQAPRELASVWADGRRAYPTLALKNGSSRAQNASSMCCRRTSGRSARMPITSNRRVRKGGFLV